MNPYRVKVKSPCFTAMSVFHVLAKGMMIADIIALIGSLDVVLGRSTDDRDPVVDFTHQLLGGLLAGLPRVARGRRSLRRSSPATLIVTFMALGPIVYVYAETKIAGFMQDRIGPKRVGPHGLLQTVADAVKLLFKEAIFPAGADKFLFILAPCLVVVGAFLSLRGRPLRQPRCRRPT